MKPEIQKLHAVWLARESQSIENTILPEISFNDLTNSIISTGPFYYYVIDFYDMSVSQVSPSIRDIHGLDPETVTFNDILGTMHPDDLNFVASAESSISDFFCKKVGAEKLLNYKINYCIRGRIPNGEYVMMNHQAIMLTLNRNGGYGKSLNIHTRIDHLTDANTYRFSLIGLNNEPSYMNLKTDGNFAKTSTFSKREIDIIKCISEGLNNQEIADQLFISVLTVKKHRYNILQKSDCKNTAQLIKTSILQGLI